MMRLSRPDVCSTWPSSSWFSASPSTPSCKIWMYPMMTLSGLRISCDISARNLVFALLFFFSSSASRRTPHSEMKRARSWSSWMYEWYRRSRAMANGATMPVKKTLATVFAQPFHVAEFSTVLKRYAPTMIQVAQQAKSATLQTTSAQKGLRVSSSTNMVRNMKRMVAMLRWPFCWRMTLAKTLEKKRNSIERMWSAMPHQGIHTPMTARWRVWSRPTQMTRGRSVNMDTMPYASCASVRTPFAYSLP
eukprot:Unigene6770_Nuclearia_a/m.20778 Unigene6770_Nuclearia_a/g.20778  ORF Unigene6770_Nuclearia_a/g.20778 Unigene6770_Nuclearia_a/m.20778 type:complete len:248 (+) Unigene6770_Nuclearia_a:305-1048(+)